MSKPDYTLSITNKKIWNFYNDNPHIKFEEINIIFHEFVEKFVEDMSSTLRTTINSQILNSVTEQGSQINDLKLHFSNLNAFVSKAFQDINNSNVNSQILTSVTDQNAQIVEIKTNLSSLNNTISKLNTDITNNLIVKFLDIKKEYIDDVKNIINLNSNEKTEKISALIEKYNSHLVDKTTLILNDIIPKNQEHFHKQINDTMKDFYKDISEDTAKLLQSANNDTSLKDFVNNFETKSSLMLQNIQQPVFSSLLATEERLNSNISNIKDMMSNFESKCSQMLQNSQQPVLSYITASEERLNSNILNIKDTSSILATEERLNSNISNIKDVMSNFETKCSQMLQNSQQPVLSYITASEERLNSNILNIKDTSSVNQKSQEKIFSELSDFLNKYKNSSHKGNLEQNHLLSLLTQMCPTAELVVTSNLSASGDIIMKRKDRDHILIENKDYEVNVNPKEIEKFIRDVEENNCHGIFLSQNTGITSKTNYQIEIHNGKILVYIHCVQYNKDKIQIAIDIIDNLLPKLEELETDEDDSFISKDTLDDINREYQMFASQKLAIINFLKDNNKKVISQIEDMKFSTLNNYLSTKYAFVKKDGFTCTVCNTFTAPNRKSLSAHERWCGKKK
jgi:hypothetical protein